MKNTIIQHSPSEITLNSQLSGLECQALSQEALKQFPALKSISDPQFQKNELLNYAMGRTVQAFLERNPQDLRLAPQFSPKPSANQDLHFSSTLTLYPQVTLPENLHLELEVLPPRKPNEADIQAVLESIQLEYARIERVERPAQWGDLVLVDYYLTCKGEIIPQSVQANVILLLSQKGSDSSETPSTTQAWLAGIVGLESGQEQEIAFSLEDHPHQPWRNQAAICHLKLKMVSQVQVDRLDDALAQNLGFDSLDAMLSQLAQELSMASEVNWLKSVKEQVVQKIVAQSEVAIDSAWLQKELETAFEQSDAIALRALDLSPASQEKLRQNWLKLPYLRNQKHQILKTLLVLRALIKKHGLKVEEAEMEEAFAVLAARTGQTIDVLKQEMVEKRSILLLAERILMEKVATFLLMQAKIRCQGQVIGKK
jgi:trigger factor